MKDKQRESLAVIDRIKTLAQDPQAMPPIPQGSVTILIRLLVNEDQGGEGLNSLELEDMTDMSQSNVSKYLSLLSAILPVHVPDSGLRLQRSKDARYAGKLFRYSVKWETPCPVCLGAGLCHAE